MTKYFGAPRQRRENNSPRSSSRAETSPAPTVGRMAWPQSCGQVAFVLRSGHEVLARVEGLDDDGEAIHGLTVDGKCFVVPIASVSYCVEV